MQNAYQYLVVEKISDIVCARLKTPRVADENMEDLGAELSRILDDEKAHKLIVCLGPEEPDCLISVFLAKLISLQRRLDARGGSFALAHVSEHTRGIFRAAGVEKLFHFYADKQTAVQALHPAV